MSKPSSSDKAVSLWIDHQAVGCGERCFLVVKRGRKWVRLLYAPTLTLLNVERAAFEAARPQPADAARLLRIARRQRSLHRRYGWPITQSVRRALKSE